MLRRVTLHCYCPGVIKALLCIHTAAGIIKDTAKKDVDLFFSGAPTFFLLRAEAEWRAIEDLIADGQLIEADFDGHTFYLRKPHGMHNNVDDAYDDGMEDTMKKKIIARVAPRNPIEAEITCRPYASSGTIRESDGVMRNFSSGGSYIESSHKYKSGTILILRMVRYPTIPSSIPNEERPRSICLAKVKWQQELADHNAIRYGIGLKYLD